MSKKESWRSSPKGIIFTCLIIFSLGYTVECQEGPERPKAFAAPTGLNALEIDGNKAFFKIGPTRDGITRAIADEVSPGINLQFPPNSPNDSPAYDDNIVEAVGEEDLFIPSIYRNETDKEKEEKKKTTTTTRAPPTTTRRVVTFGRETLAPAFNTPRPPLPQPPVQLPPATQTFVPRPPPPPQTQPRFPQPPPSTRPPPTRPPPPPPAPIQTRPPPPPQTRPPPPPPPQTRPPFVPQTRPPPPAPVFQTRPPPPPPVFQTRPPQTLAPAPAPTRAPFQQPQPLPAFRPQQPQRPLQPQTLPAFQQPAQPFIPQLRPVQQTRRPQPPPTTPRPTFIQPSPPPQLQPFQQQPFRPRPRPQPQPQPQQQQQQPQQQQPTPAPRPLRPFRPAVNRPQRPRTRPQDPTGLRTGFCPFTIFYQSGPAAAFEAQQTYTHFASVVSVDQCARTCHEFNCEAAFFDSENRHCQFNPGQGSNVAASCPTYPSPFLRNNVPLSAVPLKITCITCQRRRRINRINSRVFTNRLGQTRRNFNPQVIGRSIANVVHGVLIKQPQSVAIGFGPTVPREDSFHSSELESLTESLAEEEKRENAKHKSEEKKEIETSEEKKEDEPKINSDMILMNMHKLSSAEASDESKEVLSNLESNLNIIDSSTEADSPPLKASKLPLSNKSAEDEEETKPSKNLHKSAGLIKKTTSTTNLHRILAADKPIESSEDSFMSFA